VEPGPKALASGWHKHKLAANAHNAKVILFASQTVEKATVILA
jgi:hypothetical protein